MSTYLKNHGSGKKLEILSKHWSVRANKFKSLFGDYLPSSYNEKIVDIGCSTGQIVGWLQSINYQNSFGIDSDEASINYGTENGIHNLIFDDCFSFIESLEDSSVKLFILRDITEHLSKKDLVKLIETLSIKLAFGGFIWIQTPNGVSLASNAMLYGDLTHKWLLSPTSIKQLIKKHSSLELIFLKGAHVRNFKKHQVFSRVLRGLLNYVYRFYLSSLTSINRTDVFVEANLIAVIKKKKV